MSSLFCDFLSSFKRHHMTIVWRINGTKIKTRQRQMRLMSTHDFVNKGIFPNSCMRSVSGNFIIHSTWSPWSLHRTSCPSIFLKSIKRKRKSCSKVALARNIVSLLNLSTYDMPKHSVGTSWRAQTFLSWAKCFVVKRDGDAMELWYK